MELDINGRIVAAEVTKKDGSTFELHVQGERMVQHVERGAKATTLYLADETSRRKVVVVPAREGTWVFCDGRTRLVKEQSTRRGAGHGPSSQIVTPPFPATVVAISVTQGQEVAQGDGLVVVSAMKTEMTLRAPTNGVIASINTEVGATVHPGEVLVDFEKGGKDG